MLNQTRAPRRRERRPRGTTLQRRLILFFACATAFLILAFALLLLLFGINGREEKAVRSYLSGELEHISGEISRDFGRLSLDGLGLADEIIRSCDGFFAENGLSAAALPDRPELLEPLLAAQMPALLRTLDSRSCGGVFILLDATVQPQGPRAESARAGVFVKKTQPTGLSAVGAKEYYLRGPAQLARDNGIELLGQWRMEYDVTDQPFFAAVMDGARGGDGLALSRLYYWTGRVTLKDNSEAGFLLCVPLRSGDGTVFGVCGIEVSDRMFKQLYAPGESVYANVFAVAAPVDGQALCASRGMIAGNYYLSGSRMTEDLTRGEGRARLERFAASEEAYASRSAPLRLYPSGSPYESEQWAVGVMMPEGLLTDAVRGKSGYLPAIVGVLLLLSLPASVLISRRYLRPVTRALDSIRASSYERSEEIPYLEISDLFDFLAEKDRAQERQRQQLEQRQRDAQADAASAQTALSRLADKRRREVDPDAYLHFLSQLGRLTPKEREVFQLYLDGRSGKEIVALLGFSENALKFHNRNIYEKLGVSSRKELLLYAALMRQEQAAQP